jgi:hypothetical protein
MRRTDLQWAWNACDQGAEKLNDAFVHRGLINLIAMAQ